MADGSVEFFVALLGEMKIDATRGQPYAERLVAEGYGKALFLELSAEELDELQLLEIEHEDRRQQAAKIRRELGL